MKYRNPLAPNWTSKEKKEHYDIAVTTGALAYRGNNTTVPLKTVAPGDVEFIGGLWRVQHKLHYDLFQIRDANFILGPRINVQEKNYFEYFQIASEPTYNCYGPIGAPIFNMVAARYKTNQGEFWSYGNTVPAARAFLGISLYDKYMDLIHSVACNQGRPRSK